MMLTDEEQREVLNRYVEQERRNGRIEGIVFSALGVLIAATIYRIWG